MQYPGTQVMADDSMTRDFFDGEPFPRLAYFYPTSSSTPDTPTIAVIPPEVVLSSLVP